MLISVLGAVVLGQGGGSPAGTSISYGYSSCDNALQVNLPEGKAVKVGESREETKAALVQATLAFLGERSAQPLEPSHEAAREHSGEGRPVGEDIQHIPRPRRRT